MKKKYQIVKVNVEASINSLYFKPIGAPHETHDLAQDTIEKMYGEGMYHIIEIFLISK